MIPQIDVKDVETSEFPSKTWKLDLANNRISCFIDGIDSVVQSAFMSLKTERYEHLIFSWQYGSELNTLVGKDSDYAYSEAKRMIKDALSTDTRITDVRDFSIENGIIYFTIDTIFGSRAAQTEVKS